MAMIAPLLIEYAKRSGIPAEPAIEARFRMTPPPFAFMGPIAAVHAMVEPLHIHPEYAVEFLFRGAFERADVGDPGIVHQNMNSLLAGKFIESGLDLRRVAHVTGVGGGHGRRRR